MDDDRPRPDRPGRGLAGPLPALPRPLDLASERWAALAPRVRHVLIAALAAAFLVAGEARVQHAQHRWGSEPIDLLVAVRDHAPGEQPEVRGERRPSALAPPDAVDDDTDLPPLALALPEGAVLTRAHVDPAGPGATLPPELRAVPVPVEEQWGVAAGGWVDVWILGGREEAAHLVAPHRAVLALDDGEGTEPVALVALAYDEVAAVTAGLATGTVRLAHAPSPDAAAGAEARGTGVLPADPTDPPTP